MANKSKVLIKTNYCVLRKNNIEFSRAQNSVKSKENIREGESVAAADDKKVITKWREVIVRLGAPTRFKFNFRFFTDIPQDLHPPNV